MSFSLLIYVRVVLLKQYWDPAYTEAPIYQHLKLRTEFSTLYYDVP